MHGSNATEHNAIHKVLGGLLAFSGEDNVATYDLLCVLDSDTLLFGENLFKVFLERGLRLVRATNAAARG